MDAMDYIDWDEGRDFEDEVSEDVDGENDEDLECTCQRIDIDVYDARGCEAHGRRVA